MLTTRPAMVMMVMVSLAAAPTVTTHRTSTALASTKVATKPLIERYLLI